MILHGARVTGFVLVVLFGSMLSGCETLQGLTAGATKPEAKIKSLQLTDFDLDGAGLQFDVEVTNPYPVALPVAQLDYSLASAGQTFLTGALTEQGLIPAGGSKVLPIPARVTYQDLLSAVSGVRPGDVVPYTVDAKLAVDTDALGRLELPLSHAGELPVPTVPQVELTSVDFSNLSWNEAAATLNIKLTNTNQFPINPTQFDYALALSGKSIIETSIEGGTVLESGQSTVLQVPITMSPASLGMAAFNVLSGSGATYELGGNMSVGTPFGPLSLPINASGATTFKK